MSISIQRWQERAKVTLRSLHSAWTKNDYSNWNRRHLKSTRSSKKSYTLLDILFYLSIPVGKTHFLNRLKLMDSNESLLRLIRSHRLFSYFNLLKPGSPFSHPQFLLLVHHYPFSFILRAQPRLPSSWCRVPNITTPRCSRVTYS